MYFFWFYNRVLEHGDIIFNFDAAYVICPNNGNMWMVPGTGDY